MARKQTAKVEVPGAPAATPAAAPVETSAAIEQPSVPETEDASQIIVQSEAPQPPQEQPAQATAPVVSSPTAEEIERAKAILAAAGVAVPAPALAQASNKPNPDIALDWSHLNATLAVNAPTPQDDPTRDLPHSSTIDASKIPFGRAVLSKQGWVLSSAPDPNAAKYAGK